MHRFFGPTVIDASILCLAHVDASIIYPIFIDALTYQYINNKCKGPSIRESIFASSSMIRSLATRTGSILGISKKCPSTYIRAEL